MYQWNTSQSSLARLIENIESTSNDGVTVIKQENFDMEVTNTDGVLSVTSFKMNQKEEPIVEGDNPVYLLSNGEVLVATNLTFTEIQNRYRFEPEEFFDWVRKVPFFVNIVGLNKLVLWEVI